MPRHKCPGTFCGGDNHAYDTGTVYICKAASVLYSSLNWQFCIRRDMKMGLDCQRD